MWQIIENISVKWDQLMTVLRRHYWVTKYWVPKLLELIPFSWLYQVGLFTCSQKKIPFCKYSFITKHAPNQNFQPGAHMIYFDFGDVIENVSV